MNGRQSLAVAFAPAAPARGAALQGLLAPKRGRGPEPELPVPQEPAETPKFATEPGAESPVKAAVEAPVKDGQGDLADTVPNAAPAVAPEPAGEGAPAEPVATTVPQQSVRKAPAAKPAQKASGTVPGALRNVGVYLPPALLADVKDAVYQDRTTYADLLIDAFETVDNDRIAGEFVPEITLTSSGMPRRAPRKRGEAGIQIQLRLDGLQVAWLDEKVTEFDAPSRSALVAAVFKLHIQGDQPAGK